MPPDFFNERIKFQHRLEGLAASHGDDIALYLEEAHEKLSGKIQALAVKAEDAKSLARKRYYLDKQRAEVEKVLAEVYQDIGRDIQAQAFELCRETPGMVAGMIDASLPAGITSGLDVPALSKKRILAWWDSFQVEGNFFPAYLKKLETNAADRIVKAAKQSLIQRDSVRQAQKRLQESLGIGRHSAQALAQTSLHGAAIHAEVEFYTNNPSRIDGVQFMTELDRKTCPQCIPLDREIYSLQEAPRPPIHLQCRCWLYPIMLTVNKDGKPVPIEDVLAEEGLESSKRIGRKETGERWINHRDGTRSKTFTALDVDKVDRRMTYSDWMQSMATSGNAKDRAFAREALGKTRFELVSQGKLKVNSLYYQGKLRTIDQLKELM